MFRQICTVTVLACLLAANTAKASFFEEHKDAPKCNGRKVSEIGTGDAVSTTGYGHGAALSSAVKLVLPAGWVNSVDKDVLSTPVTWAAGEPWTEALTSSMDDTVCYVIDWNTHTFYASRDIDAMNAQVAKDDIADISPADIGSEKINARYLYPGSLHQQAANWASASGYTLVWAAQDDYTIEQRQRIGGDFPTAMREALNAASAAAGPKYDLAIDNASNTVTITEAAPPSPMAQWVLRPGGLKAQLLEWAKVANYQVVWKSPQDYIVETDAKLTGSFADAVQQVVDALHGAGAGIHTTIYMGNRTVVITDAQ